jgi:hypothetical protein
MYLGSQKSMPPADIAVKLSAALGTTVEYLVTGTAPNKKSDISAYLKYRDIIDDLVTLPDSELNLLRTMIRAAAQKARSSKKMSD